VSVFRREVHYHREYVVPTPCYADDIQKAIDWCLSELPEGRRGYGDAFQVIGSDEEVVLRVRVDDK
jgi:hypothetical protein